MSNTIYLFAKQQECFPKDFFLIETIYHLGCRMYSLESSISEGAGGLWRLVIGHKGFLPLGCLFQTWPGHY